MANIEDAGLETVSSDSWPRHRPWVRITHWLIALAVLVLMVSGGTILMAHPRLYWGLAGNDLTPALIELPIGPNAHPGSFSPIVPFFDGQSDPGTASRMDEPWNQNAWARSLHFLAAWFFLGGLLLYLAIGVVSGHVRRNLLPRREETSGQALAEDVKAHLRLPYRPPHLGPPYSILQKLAYALTALVALPLMVLTGCAMSPAIAAGWPILLDLFGGTQSARTIHFFTFAFIALFLLIHLAMVLLTGPARQVRAMTIGGTE